MPAEPIASPQATAPPAPVAIARSAAVPRSQPSQKPAVVPVAPHRLIPAAAVALILLIAIWAGVRALRNHPGSAPPPARASSSAPQHTESAVSPAPAASAPATPGVLHEEMPVISRSARESIRGQIKVAVRVTVDRSGNVAAANLEVPGSSKYFARAATDAAKKWKFSPADAGTTREWLLQFEFSRNGATGHAISR